MATGHQTRNFNYDPETREDGTLKSIEFSEGNLPEYAKNLEETLLRVVSIYCFHSKPRVERYTDLRVMEEVERWLENALSDVEKPILDDQKFDGRCIHLIYCNLEKLKRQTNRYWIVPMIRLEEKLGISRNDHMRSEVRFSHYTGGVSQNVSLLNYFPNLDADMPWKYTMDIHSIGTTSWIFLPSTRTTFALLGLEYSDNITRHIKIMHHMRSLSFCSLGHPLAWALPILHCCRAQTMIVSKSVKDKIVLVQMYTGMHSYSASTASRVTHIESSDQPDLLVLTKEVLSTSTAIADEESHCKGFAQFSNCLRRDNLRFSKHCLTHPGAQSADQRLCEFVDTTVSFYEDDFIVFQQVLASARSKCEFLLQGLQNLIAQRDQQVTIRLAEESKKLAEDSKRIAEYSWRETTSMTAITVITMVFLPGTFTSTLFSTPWFSETAGAGDKRVQMKAYAIVTVTLTIVVLTTWFFWTRHRQRMRLLKNAQKEVEMKAESDRTNRFMERTNLPFTRWRSRSAQGRPEATEHGLPELTVSHA